MDVGVVTVSYGNRIEYLEKVLSRLLETKNVCKIVVVCNGVLEESKDWLLKTSKTSNKLIIHDLEHNTGSAKGFKEGMLRVLEEDIEFIWLLDDDNLPEEDCLSELKMYWDKLEGDRRKDNFCLLSYRPDRERYLDAIITENPYSMLGPKNSFLGFDIVRKIQGLFRKGNNKSTSTIPDIKYGSVAVAPYGGMFFHRLLIDKIGLPDETYFLYADDHDFSYRITRAGGDIILIADSKLEDLEKSFHLTRGKGVLNTRYFKTDNSNAIYYSVRNNIAFEQNFVTNPLIYFVNKLVYVLMLFAAMVIRFDHFWKFRIVIKGIGDSKKILRRDSV